MGSKGFQGRAGSQSVQPARNTVCVVFSLIILWGCVFSSLLVEITTHSCKLSLVLYSLSQCVCDLCVSFSPSILVFSCLNTVLVSSWSIFIPYLFSTRDKIYCFCRIEMQGKKKKKTTDNPHPAPSSNKQLLKMGVLNPWKRGCSGACIITCNIWLAVWLYKPWGCQSANWHFRFSRINSPVSAECVCAGRSLRFILSWA